jgi:hypothetical protein
MSGIPLRADPTALRYRGAQTFVRAVAARVMTEIEKSHVGEITRQYWRDDRDTDLLVRAASNPATISGAGWANSLASTALSDFISSMGPASAGSTLLASGMQLEFNGATAIMVPGFIAAAGNVGFVGEAAPIPVRMFSSAGPTIDPRKFAVITTFTREIFNHSTPSIERLVKAVLTESVGLSLDLALFDATAGDAVRPPGLRNGIAGLTPSAATNNAEAMAVATAVAPIAGNTPLVFVAAPAQAVALGLWAPNQFKYRVLASSGLSAGTVMAIAPNAVVSAMDPVPRFEISRDATIHMDTSPAQFATGGVVAAPLRSLFQTDSIGLRLIMEVSWGLRNPAGLAWMSAVNW